MYILSLTVMIKSNLMNGHDAHICLTFDSKVGPRRGACQAGGSMVDIDHVTTQTR